MTHLTRRRFLTISAACVALPTHASPAPTASWHGTALGAPASLRLEGLTDAQAAPIIAAVEAEVLRLENIFSLYRPESELSRLNQTGHLETPAPELLNVFSLCSALYDATDGAFDPTIQPLWVALAQGGDDIEIQNARQTIGWSRVSVQTDVVALPQPGQSALTLNGIAQGAISDRIANLLKSQGLQDVLINMGEIVANGQRGDGQDWQVGIAGPDGTVSKHIALRDRAIATSDANSMMLTDSQGHILAPDGQKLHHQILSVSAPNAALADGLSTALCAMPTPKMETAIGYFPGARIELYL
ncbi:FAD:protein FMN transferase [Ruegeria halocynthiae]|uniref:FAD:protein FMN transferase n=1 Tax=Ruegeria halocynthiae TaxID=985054 RepID=UPI00056CA544|nr:FAD:protein FMN transferase [Ruegeria halocynthiae]